MTSTVLEGTLNTAQSNPIQILQMQYPLTTGLFLDVAQLELHVLAN